jgi:hypothetical protein
MPKEITPTEAEHLQNLICALKGKFKIEEIVSFFLYSMKTWNEKSIFINALLQNDEMKQDLKEKLSTEMQDNGFLVIKLENMDKRSKLNDFLCSEIFPYCNEQQNQIF